MSRYDDGGMIMRFDFNNSLDSFKDGIKETAELAHVKTSEFHENYVSKIVPDCGKYGDAAKFAAEMLPGVAEYNAIKDGDWQTFAITAGIDAAALAIGAVTAGAGYAAVKGGTSVAKAGVKVATREIAEAGVEKLTKEVVEVGAKKVVKESAEVGIEKTTKEVVEAGVEKLAKESTEVGTERIVKNEALDAGISIVEKNKLDGIAREETVLKELKDKYGEENVIREALIRDKNGTPIKDILTEEARRIDFVVTKGEEIVKSIEVTSETASKLAQTAKEARILNLAREQGGAFIKMPNTGKLIEFTQDIVTEIRRLP